MPDAPIARVRADLRRVAEQLTRLHGNLNRFANEFQQGSAVPALTTALNDLHSAVEELVTLLGNASRLVDGLEEGELLERARAIVEAGDRDENHQENKEARLLGELSQVLKRLQEEVSTPNAQQDEQLAEVQDLVIKTDGLFEAVVVGVGRDNYIGLGRFRVTPEQGRPARVMISAKNEALRQLLDFLKPAVTAFSEGDQVSSKQNGERDEREHANGDRVSR